MTRFVGRSVNVPTIGIVGFNPLTALFAKGRGIGIEVEEAEDSNDTATGDSGSTSSGSSERFDSVDINGGRMFSISSSSSSGSGRCSATNVSLPTLEAPCCLQAFNTTSLLPIVSH